MQLLAEESLPYLENMIYLPMLIIILERDRELIEKGPFKLKDPYLKLVNGALKYVNKELKSSRNYLQLHHMKVIRYKIDEIFTEYVFIHEGYEEYRRYLNVRLRNRTEELLEMYFKMAGK